MPNFVSPGVYVIEKDVSDYSPTLNSSVVGIVGFASRGPIAGLNNKKATLITSPAQLILEFGEPSEAIKGQALEGALEILEATNSMRFIRCASGALEASAAVNIGGCPAIIVSGTHANPIKITTNDLGMSSIGSADLGTSSVRFTITAYDQLRAKVVNAKVFTIPKGTITLSSTEGANTGLGLKKVLGGELDTDNIGAFSDQNSANASSFLVGCGAAGNLATLGVKMEVLNDGDLWVNCSGLAAIDQLGASGVANKQITASGTTMLSTEVSYLVKSLYPGAGYVAGSVADGSTSGVSFEVARNGGTASIEQINDLGQATDQFKAGLLSGAFLEDLIGTTFDGKTSDLITANFATGEYDDTVAVTALENFTKPLDSLVAGSHTGKQGDIPSNSTANPRFLKLVQGTYNLAGGTNGQPVLQADVNTTVIGEVTAQGGKTGIEALDDPVLNISVALAPGVGVGDSQQIQNALITVAERSTDFLALLSPPFNVGRTGDAIAWSNGFDTKRSSAINSSYAALYWPWLKVFQVFDGKDRWLAPEIYGARQIGVTDNVSDPWFAPAGFVRGRLTKPTDVEVVLNQGDRDSMYSGGNVLNPVVNFPQNGIAIFGQRTTQRQPSALDRINVRRMMIYIKKQILASTQRLVFEPNDPITWQRVTDLINPMLDDIANRRGITQFKAVCDASTNTPVRVDRNEMWCTVMIKPTKTAEMVVFELNLTSQSATF
jgi:phage tail sheath protein FI